MVDFHRNIWHLEGCGRKKKKLNFDNLHLYSVERKSSKNGHGNWRSGLTRKM